MYGKINKIQEEHIWKKSMFKDDSYNGVGLFKWSITRGGVFEVDSANDEENLIKIKIINFSSNKEQKYKKI